MLLARDCLVSYRAPILPAMSPAGDQSVSTTPVVVAKVVGPRCSNHSLRYVLENGQDTSIVRNRLVTLGTQLNPRALSCLSTPITSTLAAPTSRCQAKSRGTRSAFYMSACARDRACVAHARSTATPAASRPTTL